MIYKKFLNSEIQIFSIDISRCSAQLGKKYAQQLGKDQEFIVGDASALPFKNKSFDYVYCINVLHHIKEHRNAINEMARIGIKVCCVEPNSMNPMQRRYQKTEHAKRAGDTKSFFLNELRNDFKFAGLRNIKSKRIHCIYPSFSGKILDLMIKIEPIIEKIPILNFIAGSVVIYGEND